MADMNDGLIPAPVLVALKRAMPNATDEMIAGAWQQATTANPSLKQTDPMTSAQRIASAFGSAKTTSANTASTDVPTPEYDPFKGAGFGQADLMKQYDPAILNARKAAIDAEFSKKAALLEAQMPANRASAYFGAQANPTGASVANLQKQMSDLAGLDLERQKQLYDIEKQQQLGSTAGGALGTSFLGKEKTKQEIAQETQKTATGGLALKIQQDLNRVDSPQTLLARQLLIDQFRTANVPLPRGLENATAQQLMGFMDPKVLDAFKTKTGIKQTEAETGRVVAETGKIGAETGEITQGTGITQRVTGVGPGGVTAPTAAPEAPITFNFAPGTDLKAARAVLSRQPEAAKILPAFDAQFPDVVTGKQQYSGARETPASAPTPPAAPAGITMPVGTSFRGRNLSIEAPPGAVAENVATGAQRVSSQEQFKNYQTIIAPKIDDTINLLEKTYTGKGASALASLLPGNEQAVVASALNQLNQLYPSALPAEISASLKAQAIRPGFNGTFQLPLQANQSIKMLRDAKANVERLQKYQTASDKFVAAGGLAADFYKTPEARQIGAPVATPAAAPGTAPARTGIPTVSSKAEYDKIKSGDVYIDATDGVKKRKR